MTTCLSKIDSKSQDDDIMAMCLSKSQDDDSMAMCLSNSKTQDERVMMISRKLAISQDELSMMIA
jgi:hypothetical protein